MPSVNELGGNVILVTRATTRVSCHFVRQLESGLAATRVLPSRQFRSDVGKGSTLVTTALEALSPETRRMAVVERAHVLRRLGAFTVETNLRVTVSPNSVFGAFNIVRVISRLIRCIVEMLAILTGVRGPNQFRIDRPGALDAV